MIVKKIKTDIRDEFSSLKDELQIHLKPEFDVSQAKQFLETHIPNEIIYKSELLLDTVLNYLMGEARKKIKPADVKLQNEFFDNDFRKRIHEWASQLENKFKLEPDVVNYSSDPRLKQGLIVSCITLVVGAGITLSLTPSVVGAIVSGIVTILLSAVTFKIAYDTASPKARQSVENDIDNYLKLTEKQVVEWLEKVVTAFETDFYDFCSTNGFKLEGKLDD
jgi:hypothetical protein